MKLLSSVDLVLITLASIPLLANAMPNFPKPIELYESQDGGVYTTMWHAYPMAIEGYTGKNYTVPDNLLIAVTANGKTSNFRGVISITCSNPTSSHIESSKDYTSLKVAMEEYVIPRPVVESLFAKFCR